MIEDNKLHIINEERFAVACIAVLGPANKQGTIHYQMTETENNE